MTAWQIGDVRITKIEELVEVIDGTTMVSNADRAGVKSHPWLIPHYATDEGDLIFSIHAFVIQTPDLLVMVDTCLGEGKASTVPSWNEFHSHFLERLNAAGFHRQDFDYVLCTHLHEDHVGWNTMKVDGRWEPTFPNARYLLAKSEWQHWQGSEYADDILATSIAPIKEKGLYQMVDLPHALTDNIVLAPTPGHTPGHTSIMIQSQGQTAAITGDLLLSPVQLSEPDWRSASDVDPSLARATRKHFFEQCCRDKTLVLGTHFPSPTGGILFQEGHGWKLR